MRHLLRPLALSIVLCAAATFGSTPVSATDTPPPGTGSPPEIRWEPHRFEASSGETVDAELGTFAVPENRENPDSRSIELSFVRFPATTSEPGPPIVYLAGGPGGSGTGTARGARFPLFMALREIGDVLAFDQRGTGLSSSIPRCEPGGALPLDRPLDRETARQLIESEARRCAAFWSEQGVDLDGYDTAQSADDLEDLRRALGAEKLTLWGISYGTHLAFAALDRHPGSFDKAVLASAEGPDETVKLPLRTQAFLERADAELRAANPEAPALVSNLRRALERLSEAPATVSVAHPVTGDDVRLAIGKLEIQLIAGWMIKNPETLPALANLSAAMAAGSFEPVAPVVLRVRGMFDGLGGMAEAMDAASGMSAERRARVLAERDGSLLEDVLNFPMLPDWDLAGWLGVEELPDAFRAPPSGDLPVLFLSGTLDGRTYVESHRELAAGFPNAVHVLVRGAGHDLFMASPEVEERILDFLEDGRTPADDIVVSNPFGS